MADPNRYPALAAPHVRLSGSVDYDMHRKFQDGIAAASDADPPAPPS